MNNSHLSDKSRIERDNLIKSLENYLKRDISTDNIVGWYMRREFGSKENTKTLLRHLTTEKLVEFDDFCRAVYSNWEELISDCK